MIVRDNYAIREDGLVVNVDAVDVSGVFDYRIKVDSAYWNVFKNDDTIISFSFSSTTPLKKTLNCDVYSAWAPYYLLGTIEYPAGTTKPVFFKFKKPAVEFDSNYKMDNIFFRFTKNNLRDKFVVKYFKLKVGEDDSLWVTNKNEVKPENQAIFPIGGGYHEVFPI